MGGGGSSLGEQGRSPGTKDEVPRAGGYGRGVSPLPYVEENGK